MPEVYKKGTDQRKRQYSDEKKKWRQQLRFEGLGKAFSEEDSDCWYFKKVNIDVQCLSRTVKACFAL